MIETGVVHYISLNYGIDEQFVDKRFDWLKIRSTFLIEESFDITLDQGLDLSILHI